MGIQTADFSWFDRKYEGKVKSTLEDRTELFNQTFRDMNISLSDRNKTQIKDALKELLFKLKKEFKPSLYTLAYEFLFCYAPLLGMEREEYNKYLAQFKKAASRQGDNPCMSCPFEE